MAETTELERILLKEDVLLDAILVQQAALRSAVHEKKWERLMETISAVNRLADDFKQTEAERECIAKNADPEVQRAVMPLLARVRGKLVKSQTENRSLGDYIAITRGFIQGVLDEAVPQSRSKVYSRSGKIVHSRPSSVVVNTLY
jgi:FlgN protein.